MDDDGFQDIAVANECIGDNPIKLFFQNQNDNRTFSAGQSYLFVENSWSLTTLRIADMDHDGRNDIVAVSGQNVTVFFQSDSIAGDFSDKNIIMKTGGVRSGGGGSEGGGCCFISVILP